MSAQRCLGCDVIRLASAKGDYCEACRREIKAYRNGGEKVIKPSGSPGHEVVDTWEGRRDWTHYRERSLCFGKRRPRIYVRPSDDK